MLAGAGTVPEGCLTVTHERALPNSEAIANLPRPMFAQLPIGGRPVSEIVIEERR